MALRGWGPACSVLRDELAEYVCSGQKRTLQRIKDLKQFLEWIYQDLRQVEKSSVGLGMRTAFTVDGSVSYWCTKTPTKGCHTALLEGRNLFSISFSDAIFSSR